MTKRKSKFTVGEWKGFASMTTEQRTEIARMGNKMLRKLGLEHQFTQEEAVKAGRKGGSRPKK